MFAALGNLLDLPGSAIRDTLTGNNPFDQLLDPFGSENRTSGRSMLAAMGLGDHPIIGTGLEMLLDPTTFLGGGLIRSGLKGAGIVGKLGKAGKAAKGALSAANESDDFVKAIFGSMKRGATKTGAFSKKVPDISPSGFTSVDPSGFGVAMKNLRGNLPGRKELLKAMSTKGIRNPLLGAGMIDAAMSGRAENPELLSPVEEMYFSQM